MKNILDLVPYMNHDDFTIYSNYKVPDNPTPFIDLFGDKEYGTIQVHNIEEDSCDGHEVIRYWGTACGGWKKGKPFFLYLQTPVYAYHEWIENNGNKVLDLVTKLPVR